MRTVLRIFALVAAATLSASAFAGDAVSLSYQRLDPMPPHPDLSAATLVNACIDIRANQTELDKKLSATCPRWPAVRDFCNNPLRFDSPSDQEAMLIKAGDCPVRGEQTPAAKNVEPKSLPGGAGLASTQDAILSALAAFMVERAEQEAVLSAADGLQTVLCKNDQAKLLFPTVCDLLGTEDVYDTPPSWTALRTAAGRDFYDLPLALLEQHPTGDVDRDQGTLTATDFLQQTIFGQPPLPLLAAVSMRFEKDAKPPQPGKIVNPLRTALYVAGMAAQIAWPAFEEVQTYADRALAAAISSRRLYERLRTQGIVIEQAALRTLQAVVQSLSDSHLFATAANDASASEGGESPSGARLSLALARSLTVAYPMLAPGGHGKDVLAAVGLLADAVQALSARDYPRALVHVVTCLKRIDQSKPMPPNVLRYAQLLADLAMAEDPEQAKQVIVSAAAPVGSWRGKRTYGRFTFSVNGYVGGQLGYEWLGSSDLPRAPSWNYGLYAPLGFEGTVGLGRCGGSLGVFFSALDLGALLRFRTKDSEAKSSNSTSTVQTEQTPAYTFKEVFSPGVFLRYGFGPLPLVLGVGASITPELRRVTVVSNQTRRDLPAFQISAFAALDLTLLAF